MKVSTNESYINKNHQKGNFLKLLFIILKNSKLCKNQKRIHKIILEKTKFELKADKIF